MKCYVALCLIIQGPSPETVVMFLSSTSFFGINLEKGVSLMMVAKKWARRYALKPTVSFESPLPHSHTLPSTPEDCPPPRSGPFLKLVPTSHFLLHFKRFPLPQFSGPLLNLSSTFHSTPMHLSSSSFSKSYHIAGTESDLKPSTKFTTKCLYRVAMEVITSDNRE